MVSFGPIRLREALLPSSPVPHTCSPNPESGTGPSLRFPEGQVSIGLEAVVTASARDPFGLGPWEVTLEPTALLRILETVPLKTSCILRTLI